MQQQAPRLVAGRYEVGEVVGRGGYGMVCRGHDRESGRTVAMKMLTPDGARDPNVVERMLREQQALVALSGTCAVKALDLCRLDSGSPCLVMEWLEGRDLEQALSEWEIRGEHGGSRLLGVLEPVTDTLQRAHELGIVHRDIKPANIFLTDGETPGVRLLDFGLSRMKSAAPLTAIGMVMGSPSYIAPETWRGNSATLDGRADLFSLGVIVFRWLSGKLPFDAPDLIAKMTAVTSGPRPSVRELCPNLPAAVDAWMARALAIEPSDRFQTGGDFYTALVLALDGREWQGSDAEASGLRPIKGKMAEARRRGAFASAWEAASSLLKRFTFPPHTEGQPAPALPQAASQTVLPGDEAEHAPTSEHQSVWLDSAELEELAHLPPPPPPPPRSPEPPKPKVKAKDKGKAKDKDKTKAKAMGATEASPLPDKSHKARGKKHKKAAKRKKRR